VHDNFATFRGFFHQEGYGSHAQTSEREERNDVEIRKQAGLLLDSLIDLRQGLMTSVLLGDRLGHKPEASTGINSAAIVFAYLPRSKYAFPCI